MIYHKIKTILEKESFKSFLQNVKLEEEKGLINVTSHKEYEGVFILDYSKVCNSMSDFNDYTSVCRGLVIDVNKEEVLSLAYPKFWNYGQVLNEIPKDESFDVFCKEDGSMLSLSFFNGKWNCHTRGSFYSEQAKWSQEWAENNIDLTKLNKDYTYIFECVGPQNTIVVHYEFSGLILTGVFNKKTFEELTNIEEIAKELNVRVTERFNFSSLEEMVKLSETLPSQKEGWVVRFKNGFRIKIKGSEYCRIHRIISNITPLAIFEVLKNEDDIETIRKEIPEEFLSYYDNVMNELNIQFKEIKANFCMNAQYFIGKSLKDIGLYCNDKDKNINDVFKSLIFAYVKNNCEFNKKMNDRIWDEIRPKNNNLTNGKTFEKRNIDLNG